MRKMVLLTCLAAVSVAAANVMYGVEVKLTLQETAQAARSPGVVTMGVPFARGAVKDVAALTVSLGGKPVPAQFTKIAPWDDGSIRWALLDVQADVPAGGVLELTVSDKGGNPAPATPLKVDDTGDEVKVSAGPLQFVVSRKKPGLFQSLTVDGKELINGTGRGLVVVKDDNSEVAAAPPGEITVEQSGPMRAVVCLRGKFPGVHKDLLTYTVRISAFAGQKMVKVHAWLENQGGMGYWTPPKGSNYQQMIPSNCEWFKFNGMHVELGLGLGGAVTAGCESAKADALKIYQTCKPVATMPAKGPSPRGPYFTWDNFEYTITSGGKELAKGDRTDGVVTLTGPNGSLVTAIRDFWQNYDKAIEVSGDKLRLWLWPTEGQWPRTKKYRTEYYTYYDKAIDTLNVDGHFYYLQGGVHKGHEFVLDFSGRDARTVGAGLDAPLVAFAPVEYYVVTEAAPGIFAPPETRTGDKSCDFKLDAWTRMAKGLVDPENPSGFIKAQQETPVKRAENFAAEDTYWFGWMDYGDIPVPGLGPVSLHFDWTWIALINAMRTGDADSMRLGAAMARHRIDIDELWSDRDPAECRGLQRGDYNFPAFHSYRLYNPPTLVTNWLSGVVLYYMLTGEPKALECARRNAEAQQTRWAAPRAPRGDMAATAWSISSYLAMYDLTADKKWQDDALALFRANVTEVYKAWGPFLHDPDHQIRGQTYMKEDEKYCYALTAFCDLHRHTDDKEVLKLLTEGCEQEWPGTFFGAPKFLADLYAYVGYQTRNAEYLAKAAELFSEGFPESKNPPVILPGSSTWSRAAAMTLRSGHILQYANWKMKSAGKPGGK